MGGHVLGAMNCLEANKRNLHSKKCSQNVKYAVANIDSGVHFSNN